MPDLDRVRPSRRKLVSPTYKLQALVNEPRRLQDEADIQAFLAVVRDYYRLFDREPELDRLLSQTKGGRLRRP